MIKPLFCKVKKMLQNIFGCDIIRGRFGSNGYPANFAKNPWGGKSEHTPRRKAGQDGSG